MLYNASSVLLFCFQMQAIPGVVAVVQASDIPGLNDWRPKEMFPDVVSEVIID